ncbi:Uncharacterized conserved protein, Ntn-hydrolase superfamily [Cribrihabitans marinus]|uniref:Uncharacterized conserved protein, Ntn-hydrolase superfamily n=1 Tax=Cribrihabitans marinus TaxID=1227549 RepID=A0A1H7D2M1_9RHOB|nr:DUF1028 domain-containing protein [Cribrihabitans marinus]GGH37430.1 hypothetical protein GCM10010973_31970 [Cribrihabitans marinus]SEJ95654.1 Uncharacterized conserved protein, Ntn-hydrolase superfamily [Cribrihabitans marinus]
MTFSILARDPETGAFGGAAATGSLCVGGWVLRGDARVGLSASQGAAPSTLWGEDVLVLMRAGVDAATAVARVTQADAGRDWRQLAALGAAGQGAAFTGRSNTPEMGSRCFDGSVVSGNMLTGETVLDAMQAAIQPGPDPFAKRLLGALRAAERAGGDSRGLLSAALLVLHPTRAPLTLRIDHHRGDPIGALEELHGLATSGDYADWTAQVPTLAAPERFLD